MSAQAQPTAVVTTAQPQQPAPMQFSPSCQQDTQCGFARCNMQTHRCVFPCGSSSDCQQGAQCLMAGTPAAACVPAGLPGLPNLFGNTPGATP